MCFISESGVKWRFWISTEILIGLSLLSLELSEILAQVQLSLHAWASKKLLSMSILNHIFTMSDFEFNLMKYNLTFQDLETYTPLIKGWLNPVFNSFVFSFVIIVFLVHKAIYKAFKRLGQRHINEILVPTMVSPFCSRRSLQRSGALSFHFFVAVVLLHI